jgi:hypothetical protein
MNSEILYILDVSSTKYNLLMMFILINVYVNVLSNITLYTYSVAVYIWTKAVVTCFVFSDWSITEYW